MRRARLALLGLALALGTLGLAAPAAPAEFHLIKIREVYPGSAANPESEYVMLQMYASGQEFVKGHPVRFYDAGGALLGSDTLLKDVANGQSQRTVLVGTAAAEAQFGVAVDAAMTPGRLDPSGGAVCWTSLDCVSWGGFSGGALPSPTGSPADPTGIPEGMALRRTIARSCATLLEEADDGNDSAADFFDAFPAPRPNSVEPSERACKSGTDGPGGAGEGDAGGPARRLQTRIVRGPGRVTADRTPTFRFRANRRASFRCKMDSRRARRCRSPFTWKRLSYGCHVFRVWARAGGTVDPTPAVYRFRVVKRKRPGLRQFRRCRRGA
ncbi:MAG: hypothetical protein WD404_03550 [Solirubrobacterales bacterium]